MARHNRDVMQRYNPMEIALYFATNNGAPLLGKCIMFNLGNENVKYEDKSAQTQVTGDLTDSVTVSVQIPNLAKANDFDKDVKK